MNQFKRLAVELGIIGLVIGLVLWFARKRSVGVIPPNTDATISVEDGRVTIEKNNERIIRYAPKGTKIVINKDGSVKVVTKQYGLCHEFGAGFMADGRRAYAQADVKLAFVSRFGVHLNIGVGQSDKRAVFLPAFSLSYTLPFHAVSNTSLFVGHSLLGPDWVIGARVRF